MAQTRERILEAVIAILGEPGVELTVAEAAHRAGVAVRTAYRHFPTKEALLDAFNEWSSARAGFVPPPKSLDEVPGWASILGRTFAANEAVFRASTRSQAADEVRLRRKMTQARAVQKVVDEGVPTADPVVRKQAAAAMLTTLGFDTWMQLRDIWKLEPDEAIATMEWMVAALLAQLHKAAKRR